MRQGKEALMPLSISSPAFAPGASIPPQFTCEGRDLAPALEWRGVPAGAKSLALIVDDPDAPDPKAPKMTWVHWVAFNIPAAAAGLPEGGALPKGAASGVNDWKRTGYGGPCPPIGRHRYFFKLFALDSELRLGKPTKAELEAAMKGHVLEKAELMGTYEKGKR
jgi:Raf kinase inhibitor-like YbhB/YbcL family protein